MPGSEEEKLDWKRSQPANYSHWNRFPLRDFDQCLMLLLGIEPGSRIKERSIQDRHDRLWELIQSSKSAGKLVGRYPYHQDIEPSKFIEWAESIGEPIPEGWKPVGAGPASEQQAARDVDHSEIVEPIEEQEHDQKPQNDEEKSGIEFKIADDLFSRLSDDSSIPDNPGGTTIFDYLTKAGALKLDDGTPYFLHNQNSHDGQRKGIGNREYSGVTINHTTDGKLQKLKFRKLVDAFALRKKQEIPQ